MSCEVSASPSMPSLMKTPVVADVELLHHEAPEPRGHLPVDLQPDDVAAAAALERRLVEGDEILGLLLDLDVAVAQDAKGALAARDEAGKQLGDEHADRRLDADEPGSEPGAIRGGGVGGQPDEARQLARDRQQRVHGLAVALAPQLDTHGERAVLDERERVRRIDGDRRENRQVAGEEVLLQPDPLGRQQLLGLDDDDADGGELDLERVPAGLLVADEAGGEAVDLGELLGGRQPVLARLHDARAELPVEARHAHHVELVEVGRRDRQEAQALQHRMAFGSASPP